MHRLLSVLAVGLFVLVAAPQNALACHIGTPHGNETSCDGAPTGGAVVFEGYSAATTVMGNAGVTGTN